MQPDALQELQDDLMNLMTIMYIIIQETLGDPSDMAPVYTRLRMLGPWRPPLLSIPALANDRQSS